MAGKQQRIALTEEFINLFREERSLWDAASPLYRCKDAKHSSILKLKAKFQMPESEVKKKINALRTYFTKELAKGPKMIAAGRKETYVSKWPHYQSLIFLRDTINPRKTVTLPNRACNCDECLEKEGYTNQNGGSECLVEDLDDNMTEHDDAQKRRPSTQPMIKDKRRKTGTIGTEVSVLEETLPVCEATQNKTVDADDVFGQHVAASLRNIKEYRSKEYLKVKIQELIFEAQFGMLPMPSRQANIRPGPSAFLPICQHLVHSNANQGNTESAPQTSTCVDI